MTTRRSARRGTAREFPRTARLNELLREIVADELERIDDERLPLLTVVSVAVEADLGRATVFYDNLEGPDGDEVTLEALGDARKRLQAAVGRQAHMKRTPELLFAPDPAIRAGARIDAILRDIDPADADTESSAPAGSAEPSAPGDGRGPGEDPGAEPDR